MTAPTSRAPNDKLKQRAGHGTYRVDAPEDADPEAGRCLFATAYVNRP
jgi:hypothetical protein